MKKILRKVQKIIWFIQAYSFRVGFFVTEIKVYPWTTFSVCPRCKSTLECEYQSFCDRCGQKLDWRKFNDTIVVTYRGID